MSEKSATIRKREAIRSRNNKDVRALTIKRHSTSPLTGKRHLTKPEERREAQFFLRRAWASSLLSIMKDELKWSWKAIYYYTGRSRQTWTNVTESYYFSTAELHEDHNRISYYRPVTDGFIARVVYELTDAVKQDVGVACNYSVATRSFVDAYWLGLECVKLGRGQEAYILGRINDNILHPIPQTGKKHRQLNEGWVLDKWHDEVPFDNFIHCVQSSDSKPTPTTHFPILETGDLEFGMHKCFGFAQELEGIVFGIKNHETGEPDPRATLLHTMWEFDQQEKGLSMGPKMANPNRFDEAQESYDAEQLEELVAYGLMDREEADLIHNRQAEDKNRLAQAEMREQQEYHDEVITETINNEMEEDLHKLGNEKQKRLPIKMKTSMRPKRLARASMADESIKVDLMIPVLKEYIPKSGVGHVEFKLVIDVEDGRYVGHAVRVVGLQ